jgi:hypothetical protein
VKRGEHQRFHLREGVDGEFRDGHELVGGDEAAAIAVELAEAVVQGHDLLLRDYLPSPESIG